MKFSKQAEKQLKKLEVKVRGRLLEAIFNLPNGDVKKLVGQKDRFRLRMGKYRAIYIIENNGYLIQKIDIRGDIYNNINEVIL
jgi:mRNA interferase RelE/StbE